MMLDSYISAIFLQLSQIYLIWLIQSISTQSSSKPSRSVSTSLTCQLTSCNPACVVISHSHGTLKDHVPLIQKKTYAEKRKDDDVPHVDVVDGIKTPNARKSPSNPKLILKLWFSWNISYFFSLQTSLQTSNSDSRVIE